MFRKFCFHFWFRGLWLINLIIISFTLTSYLTWHCVKTHPEHSWVLTHVHMGPDHHRSRALSHPTQLRGFSDQGKERGFAGWLCWAGVDGPRHEDELCHCPHTASVPHLQSWIRFRVGDVKFLKELFKTDMFQVDLKLCEKWEPLLLTVNYICKNKVNIKKFTH